MDIADGSGAVSEVEKKRGGNVVGQVTHYSEFAAKRGEIETESIALVDGKPRGREFSYNFV